MEIVGVALMPSTAGGGVGLTGFPPDVFTELDVEFQIVGGEPAVLPAATASPNPSQPPDAAQLSSSSSGTTSRKGVRTATSMAWILLLWARPGERKLSASHRSCT